MEYRFKAGDKVEAREVHSLRWRLGWVQSQAGYRGSEGYYVAWSHPPDGRQWRDWDSKSGWQMGSTVRPVTKACTCGSLTGLHDCDCEQIPEVVREAWSESVDESFARIRRTRACYVCGELVGGCKHAAADA